MVRRFCPKTFSREKKRKRKKKVKKSYKILFPPPISLYIYEIIEAGRGKKKGGGLYGVRAGNKIFFSFIWFGKFKSQP